jgi:hypothetical protein
MTFTVRQKSHHPTATVTPLFMLFDAEDFWLLPARKST